MKKYIYLTVCLAVLSISQAKAQAAKVALQHNGFVTLYNADELQKALNASVDGDTLYLNEGVFSGGITISKRVSVIGAGENTKISGDVTISASGTFTARVLDGLNIIGAVKLTAITNGVNIRKCSFRSFSASNQTDNAFIDRCNQNISNYNTDYVGISSYLKNTRIANSVIGQCGGSVSNVGDVVFCNCNIDRFSFSTGATFNNCNVYIRNSTFVTNCFFSYCYLSGDVSDISSYIKQNCSTESPMTGSDGTPVGITGGTTPYTLVPSVPTVTSYNLNVNTTTKRLNVNISVESK